MDDISTGCESLDKVLRGGIPLGKITLIYGAPSTGKTTLAMKVVLNYLNSECKVPHLHNRALYIDSDKKFSLERFSQIVGTSIKEVLERLLIFMPKNFVEQTRVIEGLDSFTSRDIRLIVLDTITSLYRERIANTGKIFPVNRELNRQLAHLKEYAESKGLGILLLSQVYSSLQPNTLPMEPVSSRLLRYWSDIILRLDLNHQPGVRTASLEKPRKDNIRCRFKLAPLGIIDMGFL